MAEICAFLCSPAASYVTGQTIHVNGGAWPTNRFTAGEHGTFAAAVLPPS